MKLDDLDIKYRKCNLNDFRSICNLQEEVFQHLGNEDMLRRNTAEMLQCCLEDPHYTLGAFYRNELIAFAILYDGEKTIENIGLDIGITGEELNSVINMKLIIVSPYYRGNGLQRKLMLLLEPVAKRKRKKLICGTVSPSNIYSCNNFQQLGYEIKATKIKYEGKLRNIYCKRI